MSHLSKTPVLVILLGVVPFSDSAAQQQQIPDSALRESWEALLTELAGGPEGAPEGRRAISATLENRIFTPAFDHHKQPPRPERARLRDRIAEIANLEVREPEEWQRCTSELPTNDPAATCEFLPGYAYVVAISIAHEIPGQKQLIFYSVLFPSASKRQPIVAAFYEATFENNGGNWTLTGFRFAGIT